MFQRADLLLGRWPRLFTIRIHAENIMVVDCRQQPIRARLICFVLAFHVGDRPFHFSAPGPASEDDAPELIHGERMKPSEGFCNILSALSTETDSVLQNLHLSLISPVQMRAAAGSPQRSIHLLAWTHTAAIFSDVLGTSTTASFLTPAARH